MQAFADSDWFFAILWIGTFTSNFWGRGCALRVRRGVSECTTKFSFGCWKFPFPNRFCALLMHSDHKRIKVLIDVEVFLFALMFALLFCLFLECCFCSTSSGILLHNVTILLILFSLITSFLIIISQVDAQVGSQSLF